MPVNGLQGFFNELYKYKAGVATNYYDTLEVTELGAQLPAVVARLHSTLLGLIT